MPTTLHTRWLRWLIVVLLGLTLGGCIMPGRGAPAGGAGEPAAGAGPKTVTIGIIAEPAGIGPFHTHTSGGGAHQVEEMVHRYLVTLDNLSHPQPEIASELPSVENGTWAIHADGTMELTYKLRPNVRWHDGVPMIADNWVFGWEVDRDPEMPNVNAVPVRYIDAISAPDDITLVMHWTQTYPFANSLLRRQLNPLQRARHEPTYRTDRERFINSPAWNLEFIGLGPYRIAEWTPGTQIRLEAFPQYHRGRPKIDTLVVRFLYDANTLLANIVSDAIDIYLPLGLEKEAALDLQRGWARPGSGNQLLIYPDGRLRFVEVQMRPDYQRPRALGDRRVREAVYRAIDRQELADAILGGLGRPADSWLAPDDPARGTTYRGVIPDYGLDVARALRLFEEVGYTRGSDGVLATRGGERFETGVWNTPGGGNDKENAIVSDRLRAIGVVAEQYIIPASRLDDSEHRASFPGLSVTALTVSLDFENARLRYRPPTRTAPLGSPRNGYNNPQTIALVDRLQVTVREVDRADLQKQIMEIAMQDLPILPLYWNVETLTMRKGITGPLPRTGRHVNYPLSTWNIHEWDRSA